MAAHEEADASTPIQTSVLNTYSLQCDWERIVRIADVDPDITALALYRWDARPRPWRPGRAPADAPAMKLWDESMGACLTDAPGAREWSSRVGVSWNDPEGYMPAASS